MEQDKMMKPIKVPDAIIVLAASIKQNAFGQWVSTDLTDADNKIGAPGGKLRILATAILAKQYPTAIVVTSGGKGSDTPKNISRVCPLLAEILRDELIEYSVSGNRIVLEKNSNSTYQQLQKLKTLIVENGWQNVLVVTNRYHLARVRAMTESKFPKLVDLTELISAEDVLLKTDPAYWEPVLLNAYASAFMSERIAKEEQGILQIKNGTYQF